MSDFTPLEKAVLSAMCDAEPEHGPTLRNLLQTAKVTDRDNTGCGFFTNLEVDRSFAPLPNYSTLSTTPSPVTMSAQVEVSGQSSLMGFILWLDNGFPTTLEGYEFGYDLDLSAVSLFDLSFSNVEPLEFIPAKSEPSFIIRLWRRLCALFPNK